MSADNFLAVCYGKRHESDENHFLVFSVGDSQYQWHFSERPSPSAMLDYCLKHENYYDNWWDIPAYDTIEAAMDAANDWMNNAVVEYGTEVFV